MTENINPYVVSADAHALMEQWTYVKGLTIPSPSYFIGMDRDLQSNLESFFGEHVEIIKERELLKSLNQIIESSSDPIVSMDRTYSQSLDQSRICGHIDVTRMVNAKLEGIGLHPRPGFLTYDEQIQNLYSKEVTPITLLDDVIFTGGSMKDAVIRLEKVNRPVKMVIAGIGIGEGIEEIRAMGIEVKCVREDKKDSDEGCERDFLAGIPLSGRTVRDVDDELYSAPYIRPFGNPESWATIPKDHVEDFSDFCLEQSANLWKKIEVLSDTTIPTAMVPRRIYKMGSYSSIVDGLNEVKNSKKVEA